MHIPDGFLDAPTSAGGGAIAVGTVAYGLRRVRTAAADVALPLAGLTSAYVFAVQMLNFPVANGTSGHLLGGVLAAVLVGPWLGLICVTVVLAVQSLVFADGGLSALGLNIVNMAVIGALGGYAIFAGARALLGRSRRGILVAVALAAWFAPVLAACVFTAEYWFGGNGVVPTSSVLWSMVGVHALIGIGEAVITTMTIGAVLSTRPDLIYGAGDRELADDVRRRRPLKAFVAFAAALIVVLGAAVSPFASSSPDGLEKVAADKGIASTAQARTADRPLAGYQISAVDDRAGTSISAVIGTGVTVIVGLGVLALVRRRRMANASQ